MMQIFSWMILGEIPLGLCTEVLHLLLTDGRSLPVGWTFLS